MTDNLRIWRKVEKTNPAHTKQVNQRGGFTSISANYQILAATEQFGPIGIGWGYTSSDPIICDTLVMVPVTMWHGDRSNSFGPMIGCDEWKDKNGRIDSDAPKKAVTDALTKLLSQLGFNADVFLGKFDDNKYVEQRRREVAEEERAANAPPPDAKINDTTRDWISVKLAERQLQAIDLCSFMGITTLKDLTYGNMDAVREWIKNPQQKAA